MVSPAEKNHSNQVELARNFDHLRHAVVTVGSSPMTIGGVVYNRPPPSQDPSLVWPTSAQASTTWIIATAGPSAPDGADQTSSLSGSGSRDQRPEVQDELERVRGQAATTLGRLLFEAPPVHADQNGPAPEIICPFPPECMLHLDNTEGLDLTPLCRHCGFNSWMTFSRNEAMTTGTPASKQTYVDNSREGIFHFDRQLTSDSPELFMRSRPIGRRR